MTVCMSHTSYKEFKVSCHAEFHKIISQAGVGTSVVIHGITEGEVSTDKQNISIWWWVCDRFAVITDCDACVIQNQTISEPADRGRWDTSSYALKCYRIELIHSVGEVCIC